MSVSFENLIRCGVPLFSNPTTTSLPAPTPGFLLQSLRKLCQQVQHAPYPLDLRSKEACQAWVLAIQTEFPTFYKHLSQSIPKLDLLLPAKMSGRLIRLRRQAAAVLATYL